MLPIGDLLFSLLSSGGRRPPCSCRHAPAVRKPPSVGVVAELPYKKMPALLIIIMVTAVRVPCPPINGAHNNDGKQ